MNQDMALNVSNVTGTMYQVNQSGKHRPVAHMRHARDNAVQLCDDVFNLMRMTSKANSCFERNDITKNRQAVWIPCPVDIWHKGQRWRRHVQEHEQDRMCGFDCAKWRLGGARASVQLL